MITVATGPMSDAQEERAGLVKTHAYAVLNIVDVKGIKLLQLKNPWSHKRWKVRIEFVMDTCACTCVFMCHFIGELF